MQCKNCQNPFLESDDYCSNCGARIIRNRLTIRNLFEHLSETFFNYDNKLIRTFIALFTKPDDVIGGYIVGVATGYLIPILHLVKNENINITTIGIAGLSLSVKF